jgi:diaminohydroxyphosphoribosylaminopyrimidine deaminase/5-amino-6-(5-phosphoribosylamino)uracil reductase
VETGVLREEALVVLGPWLTALETRRPEITWPYLITSAGIEALPEGTPEADFLRRNADAVLQADGTVTEAVPGAHGTGVLELAVPTGADALAVAGCLYEGGVRRLLLHGGQDLAIPFIAAGALDRVLAYAPEGLASHRPADVLPWPELPPGFAVTGAARTGGLVRIEARRDQAAQQAAS